MIGDVQRTRLKSNLKALFLWGANDTCFREIWGRGRDCLPNGTGNGFRKKAGHFLRAQKEKTYIQKFYLYMNLTKPEEFLHISYSKVSSDGKTLRPAYLVWDLKNCFRSLLLQKKRRFHDPEGA